MTNEYRDIMRIVDGHADRLEERIVPILTATFRSAMLIGFALGTVVTLVAGGCIMSLLGFHR